ncbi:MAG: DUF1640 domain-containing protein [Rhodoferax sp.]
MSTLTFDTLKFADTLKAAGVPEKQAEAQARAVAEAFVSNSSELATKADLRAEITRLDNKIDNRMDSLTKDMQALELRLTIKLGAFITLAVATTAALVKLL